MTDKDFLIGLLSYTKQYEKDIYIRAKINNRWVSISLSKAPPDEWAKAVTDWYSSGRLPCRVVNDSIEDLKEFLEKLDCYGQGLEESVLGLKHYNEEHARNCHSDQEIKDCFNNITSELKEYNNKYEEVVTWLYGLLDS